MKHVLLMENIFIHTSKEENKTLVFHLQKISCGHSTHKNDGIKWCSRCRCRRNMLSLSLEFMKSWSFLMTSIVKMWEYTNTRIYFSSSFPFLSFSFSFLPFFIPFNLLVLIFTLNYMDLYVWLCVCLFAHITCCL